MNLKIIRAKPNPASKDFKGQTTSAAQLAAEWVDIQNTSNSNITLEGVHLLHLAYLSDGSTKWELALKLSGIIEPKEVIRIHSGKEMPIGQMNYQDRFGVERHMFTEKNYIWNNNKPDAPSLWYKPKKEWIDQTEYDACPLEGKILKRIEDTLV